jgi:hypothetical protein
MYMFTVIYAFVYLKLYIYRYGIIVFMEWHGPDVGGLGML